MTTDSVNKLLASFDDLASKADDVNVQFLIRAIKLHAELTDARIADLEQTLTASLKK
ncbi:hypothetical protein [Paraburkholderia aromaticivorans]|uniref:hypothetical protein n=1 Tax=Paraburkholderia aromaticivorans TaxID=2026199 RepID=UPI0014560E10|nr:hypothetical protein [Paraburkholderia aromaticivorans]